MANITLVQQAEKSTANELSCSLTLSNCTIGNMLIVAFTLRGQGNTATLSNGWEILGGGNVVALPSASYQCVYFSKKVVENETETVNITQDSSIASGAMRIYAVIGEFSGDFDVVMRNDMANYGSSYYNVNATKSNETDVIIYATSSAYYQGSAGRQQTATPNDLEKLQGDSAEERLACWFDNGTGALSHTFTTCNGGDSSTDAIIECVQLLPKTNKYLVRDNTTIYTVSDGALAEVQGTLNADLFTTYGTYEIPSGNLLMTLASPEVLCWKDSDKVPTLVAIVKGIPKPQIVMSKEIDLMHSSIKGIKGVTVDCKGDVLFAVSFDNKATWMQHNGTDWVDVADELTGMTELEFEAITAEQWQAKYELSSDMYIRCTLTDATQSVTSVNISFIN